MTLKVLGICGSLRKASLNMAALRACRELMPEGMSLEISEIGDLPLYNQEYDEPGTAPEQYARFREQVGAADGVLFVTPEYNRSIPGVLKNAIDIGSRPYGHSVFDKKPAAIVTASPGSIGGFGANHHLRQSMVFLNVPLLQMPEAYIGGVDKLFDEQGGIANESTRGFLDKFLAAFATWIDKTAATR